MNDVVLLTGATGYVGGRLLDELLKKGLRVRCLARRPDELRARVAPEVEVVAGDLLDAASLPAAMQGVSAAFYLVHSLGAASGFEERDREAATVLAEFVREFLHEILQSAADRRDLLGRHHARRLCRKSGNNSRFT